MSDRSIRVNLRANVTDFVTNMRAAGSATDALARDLGKTEKVSTTTMGRMAQSMKVHRESWDSVGSTMLKVGTAITGGVALATKAAMDWESAWTGVKKTVDGSPEQMAHLEAELRGLAKTLPATHAEIAGVAEAAGQLGIQTGNVAGFTRAMIDLGESTNMTAQDAAVSLARFANIMGTTQDKFSNLGSSIVALGNNFQTSEREIVDMAMRLASAGRQAGLTEGDVLGLATALSSVGIEAEAGGTAMSKVMIEMRKAVDQGGPKLEAFARTAGMTGDQFQAAFKKNAGGAITSFIEGLGRMDQAGQSVQPVLEELGMTDVRVGNALRSAAANATGFASALTTGNSAFKENTALATEAEQRYATASSRIKIAWNNIKDAAIDVGAAILPVVASVANAIAAMGSAFGGLPGPVKAGIGVVGGVVGVAALAVGAFLRVAPAVMSTVEAFKKLSAISPTLASHLGSAAGKAGSFALALGKIGAAAGIAGLVAQGTKSLIEWARGIEDVSKSAAEMDGALKGAAQSGGFYNATLSELVARGGAVADRFGDMTSVLETLANSNWADRAFSNFLWMDWDLTADGFGKVRREVQQLDESLATLANSSPKQAQDAFRAMASELDMTRVSQSDVLAQMPEFADHLRSVARAAGESTDDATLWKIAVGELVPVVDEVTGETKLMSQAQVDAASAAKSTADAFADQASAMDQALSKMRELYGIAKDTITAESDWQEAIQKSSEALKNNGATLDQTTQKGRDNWNVLLGTADAALSQAEAMAKAGDSNEAIAAKVEAARAEFIRQAVQFGATGEQAEEYANRLGLIPSEVITEINAKTDAAKQRLDAILAEIAGSGEAVTIDGETVSAESSLNGLLSKIGLSREDVGIGGDDSQAIKTVGDFLAWTKRQKADSTVGANTSEGTRNVNALKDLANGRATMSVSADTSAARAAINRLHGMFSSRSWGAPMMIPAMADGGVLEFYAGGGLRENHVAQIAPAGAWRVWAEEETGGEAYIPLAPSKRRRSLDIWAETGRRLGVAGFADGGTVAPPRKFEQARQQVVYTQTVHQHISHAMVEPDSTYASNDAARVRLLMGVL